MALCRAFAVPAKKQRQLDILHNAERVDELKGLKNETDFFAAEFGKN